MQILSRSISVDPFNLSECVKKIKFHSWEVANNTSVLEINNFTLNKKISLIEISDKETIDVLDYLLTQEGLKLCDGAAFYLLGLMVKYTRVKDIHKNLWGKHVVALDHSLTPLKVGGKEGYLAVSLVYRYYRILSLIYSDSVFHNQSVILAEEI